MEGCGTRSARYNRVEPTEKSEKISNHKQTNEASGSLDGAIVGGQTSEARVSLRCGTMRVCNEDDEATRQMGKWRKIGMENISRACLPDSAVRFLFRLGWVELGWVGLGWVGLGWVRN